MPDWFRAFRASLTFLTRIPVGGFPYSPGTWKWITIWFPLVGLLLGGIQVVAWVGLEPLPDWPRCILVVATGILLTGCFHEDGLADSADALGGGHDRDSTLAILKDSRIGSFGATALFLVLFLKISLLMELGSAAPLGLLLGQSLSRVVPVIQMSLQPYARGEEEPSRSRDIVESGGFQAVLALLWGLLILGAAFRWGSVPPFQIWVMIGILLTLSVLVGITAQRKVGGVTGDFLGALQQLSEIGILVALLID